MNPQDPLANLHPLREPAAICWWPLAPGWWILLAAGIVFVITLAYLLLRRRRKNAYRRRALQQLHVMHTDYQADRDSSNFLTQINALLKSVALYAYPRVEVAAQYGEQWRTFLNRNLPANRQLQPEFDDAVYRETSTEIDMEKVHLAAQQWIKHHKVEP